MTVRRFFLRILVIACAFAGCAKATEFTPFSNTSDAGLMALATAILGDSPGITIVPGSVRFTGTTTSGVPSASFARRMDLGTHGDSFYELSRNGALFTTGDGTPPLTNSSAGYGQKQAQDVASPDLALLVGDTTHDTTALEFDFTVASGTNSLGFEFMFMSEEYPKFADSISDAAAIYVDGTNYAYYNNDPTKYLSVKSNLIAGVSIFYNNADNSMPIEYNGVTRPAGVLAPLNTSLATHHLRIAIADTVDQIYDSGLMVAGVAASDRVIAGGEAGIVPLASPRLFKYIIATKEDGPTLTIPVRLSQPALEPVTVEYEFTGSAVVGTDFTTSLTTATGSITFAIGEYIKNVTVTPLTDGITDGDKTLVFGLTDADNAIALKSKTVTLYISDLDALPPEPGPEGGTRCGSGSGIVLLLGSLLLFAWGRRRQV